MTQKNITMDIPMDGSSHKYIIGKNAQNEYVIVAKPIDSYHYHADIRRSVEHEQGELTDVRGGYARFVDGVFLFDGSSGAFGRADHKHVSRAVNGSALKTTLKIAKIKLEDKIKGEILDLQLDSYAPRELARTALQTVLFSALGSSVALAAYQGFSGTPFENMLPIHGALAGSNAVVQAAGSSAYDTNEGPVEQVIMSGGGTLAGHAVYVGLAYLAGTLAGKVLGGK